MFHLLKDIQNSFSPPGSMFWPVWDDDDIAGSGSNGVLYPKYKKMGK